MNAILVAEISPLSVAALVFVAVVAFMLLLRSQRYFRNARPEPLPSAQARRQASTASPTRVSPEIERWEVRMHDLARELSGRLDSKLSALEHLVNQADARAAQLQTLLDKLESHQQAASAGTQAERLVHPARTATGDTSSTAKQSTRQAEIYALADAGHTPQAIAAAVDSPVGEVELMLSLRQAR